MQEQDTHSPMMTQILYMYKTYIKEGTSLKQFRENLTGIIFVWKDESKEAEQDCKVNFLTDTSHKL
jgi:hypothetical protein